MERLAVKSFHRNERLETNHWQPKVLVQNPRQAVCGKLYGPASLATVFLEQSQDRQLVKLYCAFVPVIYEDSSGLRL